MAKTSKSEGFSTRIRLIEPYATEFRVKCGRNQAGKTVRQVLSEKIPRHSQEHWERIADAGNILFDGQPVDAGAMVGEGKRLTIRAERFVEPAVPDDLYTVDETGDYLVVYKPAPMPVHRGGRYNHNSLLSVLEKQKQCKLHVIHRLDVVTSGLVLFGKTQAFAAFAQRALSEGKVEKEYMSRVSGNPQWSSYECELPVHRSEGIRFAAGKNGQGKSAFTCFEVVQRGDEMSILKARPLTGRTHQIRVHLQALGHPVVDDPLYGFYPPSGSVSSMNRPISLQHIHMDFGEGLCWQIQPQFPNLFPEDFTCRS